MKKDFLLRFKQKLELRNDKLELRNKVNNNLYRKYRFPIKEVKKVS